MNQAYARGQGYAFFAEIAAVGVTPRVLPLLKNIAPLEQVLSSLPHAQGALDWESCEVLHQQLLGFHVFPMAGAFLTAEGQVGGEATRTAQEIWKKWSLRWDWSGESPEHLGEQLAVLAQLCHLESEETSVPERERLQRIQCDVLDRLLLPWLAPFLLALRQEGHPLYTTWAEMTWQWATEHRESLAERRPPGEDTVPGPFAPLLDPESWLGEKRTGLKQIARALLQPASCGWFLSRGALARIASTLALPGSVGSRFQLLESLLYAAIDRDLFASLVDALQKERERWSQGYLGLRRARPGWITLYVTPWEERLDRTSQILQRLSEASQSEGLQTLEEDAEGEAFAPPLP